MFSFKIRKVSSLTKIFIFVVLFLCLFVNSNSSVSAAPATFTVTNTNSSGAGSFSQAVIDANNNGNPLDQDVIEFNIPDSGDVDITPDSQLSIDEPLVIDGYSQSDSYPNQALAPYPFDGLIRVGIDNAASGPILINADNVEITGLALANGLTGNIVANSVDGLKLYGNYFDTRQNGLLRRKSTLNTRSIVIQDSTNVEVGGLLGSQRNIMGYCSVSCLELSGAQSSQVTIQGNYVGLGYDGITGLDNYNPGGIGGAGIKVFGGSNILIGGTTPAAGNSIERNNMGGLSVEDAESVSVLGNRILYNFSFDVHGNYGPDGGVYFGGVIDSDFGSPGGGENIVAGNFDGGVGIGNSTITSTPSENIRINSNYIGVLPSDEGLMVMGNEYKGVRVGGSSSNVLVKLNTVANVYKNNSSGVSIIDSAHDVAVLQNSIFSNEGKGISLQSTQQNLTYPTYFSATEASGNTTVDFLANVPEGDYRVEFFTNDSLDSSGRGEGKDFIDYALISSAGTGSYQTYSKLLSGTGIENLSMTITEIDQTSPSGYGATSEFGGFTGATTLSIETAGPQITQFDEFSSGHTVSQTFSNVGPDTIDTIELTDHSNCIDIESAQVTDGTASNHGAFNLTTKTWTGELLAGQSIEISYSFAISCSAPNSMALSFDVARILNDNQVLTEIDQSMYMSSYYGSVVKVVDLEIETTDGVNTILEDTGPLTITQSIRNSGDEIIDRLEFGIYELYCLNISDVALSGSASDTGTYDQLSEPRAWTGILEGGQELTITFTADLTCARDNQAYLNQVVTLIKQDDLVLSDINSDNNDCNDSTGIVAPITNVSVDKTLLNKEDIAIGGVLNYELTFTNYGPQDIELTDFDLSGPNPFTSALFTDILPDDLAFVDGSSTNSLVQCSLMGPAALAGSLLESVADYNLVFCGFSGGEQTLSEGQSISTTISVTIEKGSDLKFRNILMSGIPINDPDTQIMGSVFGEGEGCEPGSDMVVCYRNNRLNNFFETPYVADTSLNKELIDPSSVASGGIATFEISITNQGPMPFSTGFYDGAEGNILFADIYPGNLLTYTGTDSEGIECIDLGPGSASLLGAFASEHTAYNLVICGATDPDEELAVGASKSYRLNFSVNGDFESSTNYAMMTTPYTYDLDILSLNQEMFGAEGDVLDALDNPNFAKVAFSQVSSPGGGDSGGTGSSGAGGVASTGDKVAGLAIAGGLLVGVSYVVWRKYGRKV